MKPAPRLIPAIVVFFTLMISVWIPAQCSATGSRLQIEGKTMGTYYHVTCFPRQDMNNETLKRLVDKQLQMVNNSMSMYSRTSELSRFNRIVPGEEFRVSREFLLVLRTGQQLFALTNGAWDGTVKPLVDLWGFGTKKQLTRLPSPETIADLLASTGFGSIVVSENTAKKLRPGITLDLGSIAKGFGVDTLARLLQSLDMNGFIVEVGGEVITSGRKPDATPWIVGISRPDKNQLSTSLYKTVRLDAKAMATSGDYRNFIELEGRTYSHIIDPATGYPVTNGVVSVSVISDTCVFADGLATALMVMGPETGIPLVNTIPGTECLIVVRDARERLTDHESEGFSGYVVKP